MTDQQLQFQLHLTAEEYLPYYQGVAKYVMVTAHDGTTVQFSAHLLRPFVAHDGVHGEFLLRYDQGHRLIALERVDG